MTVAKKSQCLSRKIGAVLVKDKTVISTGYNGPPRGVKTCDERWLTDHVMREAAGFPALTEAGETYKDKLEGVCPRYVPEFGFKSGEGVGWCVAGHAERNALINAARMGICTKGTKLYMDCGTPCTPCLVEIINAGVEEIIITREYYYDDSAEYTLKESGLKWRVYEHLKGK
jgi:dCMP deaminase